MLRNLVIASCLWQLAIVSENKFLLALKEQIMNLTWYNLETVKREPMELGPV